MAAAAAGVVVRGWDRAFLIGRARTEEVPAGRAAVAAYFRWTGYCEGSALWSDVSLACHSKVETEPEKIGTRV